MQKQKGGGIMGGFNEQIKNQLIKELRPQKSRTSVLIVDDDMDAIVPVEMAFRKLGCQTDYAIDDSETARKLEKGMYDILVLDWYLNSKTGGDVIFEAIANRKHRAAQKLQKLLAAPLVLITHSAVPATRIRIPLSPYFFYDSHWKKPSTFENYQKSAGQIIEMVKTSRILK